MLLLPVIVTMRGLVGQLASPDQPANRHPSSGTASMVTPSPLLKTPDHGSEWTAPLTLTAPDPELLRLSVYWIRLKVTVADLSPSIVTLTGLGPPPTSPDHEVNSHPDCGTASSVTVVPLRNWAE